MVGGGEKKKYRRRRDGKVTVKIYEKVTRNHV